MADTKISALASKAIPVAADVVVIVDSDDGSNKKVALSTVVLSGGALGTPASGTLTNCGSLPVSGITASTSTALGVGSVELGHASDTTIARVAAGIVSIEGSRPKTNKVLAQVNDDATMTSGNANYNCDLCDVMEWTALAQATDFAATGGTPANGQTMTWIITGTAARALTFSGPFIAGGTTLALPTTTDTTKTLILQWMWMTILSTDSWVLVSKIEGVTG